MARGTTRIGRPDAGHDDDPHEDSAAPLEGSESADLVPQPQHDQQPGRGEHECGGENADGGARRTPIRREHGDERDRHDRLETVRDDPQSRTADRDRQRLRPADDELHGRGEQDDASRGDGPVVLLAEDEVDEPGHRHEEQRDGDEHHARRPPRVAAHAREDPGSLASLPVARLLRHEHQPGRRARSGETRLRRLRDAEEADLGRPGDDADDQRDERRPERDDARRETRLDDEGANAARVLAEWTAPARTGTAAARRPRRRR